MLILDTILQIIYSFRLEILPELKPCTVHHNLSKTNISQHSSLWRHSAHFKVSPRNTDRTSELYKPVLSASKSGSPKTSFKLLINLRVIFNLSTLPGLSYELWHWVLHSPRICKEVLQVYYVPFSIVAEPTGSSLNKQVFRESLTVLWFL